MSDSAGARAARPGPGAVGIELRGVSHRYGRRPGVLALEGLDLSVAPGELVAVVGPSGSGKSTLLEAAAGMLEPTEGAVTVGEGASAADRLALCAHMPQRDLLMPWRTALDNAGLALECRGAPRRVARQRAAPLFRRFGLGGFEQARPAELSGGMRQRVAFVRTLLAERPVVLLDEPFGSLDSITRAAMQAWLADALAVSARTALLVTHDIEEALFLADRVAILSPRPGRILTEIVVDLPRAANRRETLAHPAFAALRTRALEALEC